MERAINNFENLALAIQESNEIFLKQAQKQVNVALTLRNWVIGHHIFEYEQAGEDRSQYGERVLKHLAEQLKKMGLKSFGCDKSSSLQTILPRLSSNITGTACRIALE